MCVQHDARRSVLVDLLTVYGGGGKCIVFTQTKRDADEVSAAIANHMPTEVRGSRAPRPCCTLGRGCLRCPPSRLRRCGLQATSDCSLPSVCSVSYPCSCTGTCSTCALMHPTCATMHPSYAIKHPTCAIMHPSCAILHPACHMVGSQLLQSDRHTVCKATTDPMWS